jgi:PAS domain S-box-containing protein
MTNTIDYRPVLDALADAVVVADRAGKIVHLNPAAEDLLGWRAGEVVARPLTILMPARLQAAHLAAFDRYVTTGTSRIMGRPIRVAALHKDGRELDIDLTLSELPTGLIVAAMRDLRERVELERQQEFLALLETLLSEAPVGIGLVDRQLRYVTVNDALAAMNGLVAEAMVGRHVREILTPELADTVEPIYRRVLETGEPSVNREISGAKRDAPGELQYWVVSHYPIRGRAGDIRGVGTIGLEITERKRADRERRDLLARERAAREQAELERAHLHDLFMNAPAAIAILRGPTHVYELSSVLNNQLLGKDPTGLSVAEAFPFFVDEGVVALLDRVFSTAEPFIGREVPWRVRQADGSVRESFATFIYQPMPGPDGKPEGVLVFGFDVTEQVLSRRRVEDLATERKRLIEELQVAVRTRDDFLSIASHELKTPLTPLQLKVQMLEQHLGEHAKEGSREWFERQLAVISRQSQRLGRLVSDLLDVSQIAAGRLAMNPKRIDLLDLVREVIRELEELGTIARSGCVVSVRGSEGIVGRWDPARLEHVINNLLSNACKYGAGKPVDVDVVRDREFAVLSVMDRGIGIAPEEQARIFDKFERAAPHDRYGGFGLGLYIVRHVVEALGGSIAVASEPGRGATFTVRLPIGGEPDSQ